MRKIAPKAIAQFVVLGALEITIAGGVSFCLIGPQITDTYRGIAEIALTIILFYALAILGFRSLQRLAPLRGGQIPAGDVQEHRAFLYMLHFILVFNPLLFSRLLPFPVLGVLLRALGAHMGKNSFCAGLVMDPPFVTLGDNSLIGNDAMLIAHVIEGDELAFLPIRIGKNVTIGARAIIMAGVTIDDGAIVGVQSVVRKGAHIRCGETWVGCPARPVGGCLEDQEGNVKGQNGMA